ncbi:hypothetical protein MATL_G00029400 [Megalops atlanticus]|uniref:Uncharacterized protein n=1 Tax=Megalops atlanticus TaxID=7932 RepID=A0A9D3QCJ4_MEGAT|nr:hypothetical protein MATL_G00029400 [Megalops atlanticus]
MANDSWVGRVPGICGMAMIHRRRSGRGRRRRTVSGWKRSRSRPSRERRSGQARRAAIPAGYPRPSSKQREKSIRRKEAARGRPTQPPATGAQGPPSSQLSLSLVPASAHQARAQPSAAACVCGSAQGALRPCTAS